MCDSGIWVLRFVIFSEFSVVVELFVPPSFLICQCVIR